MNENKRDNLTWFLIAISPITFGSAIVLFISYLISLKININFNKEGGFIVCFVFFIYVLIWSKIYKKIAGYSAWD